MQLDAAYFFLKSSLHGLLFSTGGALIKRFRPSRTQIEKYTLDASMVVSSRLILNSIAQRTYFAMFFRGLALGTRQRDKTPGIPFVDIHRDIVTNLFFGLPNKKSIAAAGSLPPIAALKYKPKS
jgi:hypothetical protein